MHSQSLAPLAASVPFASVLPAASYLPQPEPQSSDHWAIHRPTVALLSNEETTRSTLRLNLDALGYASVAFQGGEDLLQAVDQGLRADVLLLSFGSTEKADHQLALLRSRLCTPVVMMVPRKTESDQGRYVRYWMQDGGRIDFIGGEPTAWELEHRIRALLGESPADLAAPAHPEPGNEASDSYEWSFDRYSFVEGHSVVRLDSREIQLKPREFELARMLFRNVDKLLSRDWLWRSLWGGNAKQSPSRAVDVCAANVRKKLELRPGNGLILNAVYGRGYRLVRVAPHSRRGKSAWPSTPDQSQVLEDDQHSRASSEAQG